MFRARVRVRARVRARARVFRARVQGPEFRARVRVGAKVPASVKVGASGLRFRWGLGLSLFFLLA